MKHGEARPVCKVGATLGEGPVWVPSDEALWFVDIKKRRLHRYRPEGDARLESWEAPAQPGWIVPTVDGRYLCGLQTGLHHFDPASGAFTLFAEVEPDLPGNRLNDATVDCRGRLWFGSMDDGERAPTGRFYRADERGIAAVIDGVVITNGPAVSPDGTLLYHTDTLNRTIHVSRIGPDGVLSDTRLFVAFDPEEGHPDGPTVDAEGCVWTALWGGWSARRYTPAGELLQTVRFPVANVTKIALGGPDGRTAYATTASKGLSKADHAAQPHAGDLFAFEAEVPGQPICLAGPIRPEP